MSGSPDQRLRRLEREGGETPEALLALASGLLRTGRPGEAQAATIRALERDPALLRQPGQRERVRGLLPPGLARAWTDLVVEHGDRGAAWPGLRSLGRARALAAPGPVRGGPADLGGGLIACAVEGTRPALVALSVLDGALVWSAPGRRTPLLALPELLLVREEQAEGRPARVAALDPASGEPLERELDPLLLALGGRTPVQAGAAGELLALPLGPRWSDPPGQLLLLDATTLAPRRLQLGPGGARLLAATGDGGLLVGEPGRTQVLEPDGTPRWSVEGGRALGVLGRRVLLQERPDALSTRELASGDPGPARSDRAGWSGRALVLAARPCPLLLAEGGLEALDPETLAPRWRAFPDRRDEVTCSADAVLLVRRRLLDETSGRQGWPELVESQDPLTGEVISACLLDRVPAAGDAFLAAGRLVLASWAPDVACVVVDPA